MRNLSPLRARWIRRRMGLVCGLMGLGCGVVVSSAYRVQVEDGPAWRELAELQRQRRLHINPKRGSLYDRNQVPLAVSIEVPSVSADTVEMFRGVDEKYRDAAVHNAAQRVAPLLHLDPTELEAKFGSRRRFVWIKRRISADEAAAVKALADPRQVATPLRGLQVEGEGHRYYPNRQLAGPLLGFVSPDGEGKEGLELSLDDELRGHLEEIRGLRDRSGRLLFSEGLHNEKALAGHSVHLSVDQGIQYIAEQELESAVHTYEAVGGSVVVTDPHTGEILALASNPTFNPNDAAKSEPDARRNRATHDRFEPGSTMKLFTVASGLAAHTLTPKQKIFCERGSMAIDDVVIHDTHVNDWMTVSQILAVSSNIGAAKIGLELGESRLYESFRRFGFGEETGLPLPGEASGVLRSRGRPWVQVETAAASFGQGVSVTSLQLALALGAVANGGKLMEPILIRSVVDGLGNIVRETHPRTRREALPPTVARTVAEMLVGVTEGEGTGIEAALPGFKVAGKTATAQKVDPATGKYTQDRFTSSFIGFVPADRPRIVIVVVLDEPMLTHAGGAVAAPAFRRVAEFALRYLGVTPPNAPDANLDRVSKTAPPIVPPAAMIQPVALPLKTTASPQPAVINAFVEPGKGTLNVPSLVGMPLREALRLLTQQDLHPSPQGTGIVMRQEPPAGAVVAPGTTIKLFLEPPA